MDPDTALERLNYFQGQLLSVSDLSGLKVTMANSSEIVVEPGVAIDCAGNEIHVCAN
ncbi:MAG TPA: hypothetical protein VHE60_01595 [Pyrinomonadaceae bacterium]|nr:hypothetical protein [Pyrinomonadaceae bacterium]